MTDQEVENELVAKGLTAPRITAEQIQSEIVTEDYHRFPGTTVTVCCLTLANGFTGVGHSACVSSANFDAEMGKKIARCNAFESLWPLFGFALADRLYRDACADIEHHF